jgi:hypothetical protein
LALRITTKPHGQTILTQDRLGQCISMINHELEASAPGMG